MKSFRKTLQNRDFLEQEIAGHSFFTQYYHKVPNIVSIDEFSCSIDYENIASAKNKTLFSMLRNNESVDMSHIFTELAQITHENSKLSNIVTGGTKKFYIDRLVMVQSERLISNYEHFLTQQEPISINSLKIPKKYDALSYVKAFTESLAITYVAPSQGDLHDMNIFQNGHIVDFEAAGWNRISTDIATFLHHVLFVGNYFGPKYAKWANYPPVKYSKEVTVRKREGTQIDISNARKKLIKEYMRFYVDNIDTNVVTGIDREICVMIALRLLTVFDVTKMSNEDNEITFTLVNYFLSDDSIDTKLAPFLG